MKAIILKFSGPLQSWGINSNFETRDTARYPTKSAVIGMIASALGYRREEQEKISELNQLSFGVRVEQQGTLLRDFHIARSTKQSYVTNRYYLQDAVFLVMISHQDSKYIETIEKALKHPVFPLYMGRRSAPVNSDFFVDCIEADLCSIIKSYPWQASKWYMKRNQNKNKIILDAFVDVNLINDFSQPIYTKDEVLSFDIRNRRHGFRAVKAIGIELLIQEQKEETYEETKHDIFQWLGGK